ncbi:Lrp/AsnC family transcriptional regulator [Actinoallomurus sp. NBC_01490]|uniref:Lrp/AsnC family transcriptional regulator n=1 Tax=Actinoallomurus sp. NBC_01490 TaxID=2903557 RepID=UPI002E381F96|nr:Lrp/AsnC family transcriptional regulator [Actinoallomurus sp. NBC_01490]
MDAVDREILRRLQRDGRQTNRELAQAVGIAPSTALERTRALRERGVITGFHAGVDMTALGRSVQALISIRIRPQSREAIESVRDSMAKLPETLGVFVVTGNEDLLVHVAVPSTRYLRDFVLDRLARRKEFVDVRTTVVFDYVQPAEQSELSDVVERDHRTSYG